MFTKDSYTLLKETDKFVKKHVDNPYLRELYSFYENHEFDYDEPKYRSGRGVFPNNKFIPDKLGSEIASYRNKQTITWNVTSEYTISCTLCTYTKGRNFKKETLNLLINAISFIMSFSNRDFKLKLNLVLLPYKKKFNKKFTSNEINSGMASSSSSESEIFIWRLEECIKVIFHECIHALGLSNINDTTELIDHYNTKYKCNSSRVTINETYTEVWAKLFNCYFLTNLKKNDETTLDLYDYFCYLISIEKEFSLLQSSKIQEYLNKNINFDINQHTNVVAYYVATSEILEDLYGFLKFKSNEKNLIYLQNEKEFLNILLRNNKVKFKKVDHTKYYYKTFRMTASELKIR